MEFILLGILAKVGLAFILVATLVLLAMHAVENRKSAWTELSQRRRPVDAVAFRLHHLPSVNPTKADETLEEPAQRAA